MEFALRWADQSESSSLADRVVALLADRLAEVVDTLAASSAETADTSAGTFPAAAAVDLMGSTFVRYSLACMQVAPEASDIVPLVEPMHRDL